MPRVNRKERPPVSRARLYEKKAAELLLRQWNADWRRLGFPALDAAFDLRARSAVLRRVAFAMHSAEGGAADSISSSRLSGLIEDCLREDIRLPHPAAVAQALVGQLQEGGGVLCFLGGDGYGFVHPGFLHYFCAAELAFRFKKKKGLSLEGLISLFDRHCRNNSWQEVLCLLCGLIHERHAGQLIAHLTRQADMEAWQRRQWYNKTPPPELLLAVRCLGEVRNPARIEEKTGAELLLKVIACLLEGELVFDLCQAAAAVGPRWPGKSAFRFDGRSPEEGQVIANDAWPAFLAAVFQEREWIERLCLSEDWVIRCNALQTLAASWPDEETRRLLMRRAVQDDDDCVRYIALRLLAVFWPEEELHQLLKGFFSVNGAAASLHGRGHSRFGEFVFQNGFSYFDPRRPIPAAHIREAAEEAGVPIEKIDEAVHSLSAYLGWDITKGSQSGKLV